MTNKPNHLFFGLVVGCFDVILSVLLVDIFERIYAVTYSTLYTLVGVVIFSFILISATMSASMIPDYLEPPLHRFHRSLFHSQTMLVLGTIMAIIGVLLAMFSVDLVVTLGACLFTALVSGYLSHLLLDYPLPKFTRKKPFHFQNRW